MKAGTRVQLSIMMFLQFFIWGAWYVVMGTYLFKIGFDGLNVGAAFSTVNWGAILSPFVIGIIADRFFPSERVMAVLHIAGGVLLWVVSGILAPGAFFWVLLAYSVLYMPTLALANAISFYQMAHPEKEFPRIRVLGTIGWIVAGLLIGFMGIEATNMPFRIAAAASIVLGIYAFFLPHTPPKDKGKEVSFSDIIGLDALQLMKNRSFAVFILSSLLISIPLAFYYSFTNPFLNEVGMQNAAGKMTLGQASEIIFMLLMPVFFTRLGVKKMILIGMLAWVLRYLLFAYGNNGELVGMFYLGIILHGVCYDFFFVTGQIYVDNTAPKAIQASAQGFITLITYGVGMLIGSWASGWVVDQYTLSGGGHLWRSIWLAPAFLALGISILFVLFFKEPKALPY
ncbi:MAG: nucleoside permease [Lewinellaceae bacterium]|nr:nucleoside permease [Lewinellaceae bacterium]